MYTRDDCFNFLAIVTERLIEKLTIFSCDYKMTSPEEKLLLTVGSPEKAAAKPSIGKKEQDGTVGMKYLFSSCCLTARSSAWGD